MLLKAEVLSRLIGADKELVPASHSNGQFYAHDPDTGLHLPIPAGGAEERSTAIGAAAFTWTTVASVPNLQRLQIIGKSLLKRMTLRLAGTWDQSVGAETQATEGNPILVQEVRLNCDGRVLRRWRGPVLFEADRITFKGATLKTDPTVGIAAGKAFSSTLIMDMGFLDARDRDWEELTYLDLSNYANVFLEIQMDAFNRYASGSTQANMAATVTASAVEIIGPRRVPQRHFEALLVNVEDMTTTGNDRRVPLIRSSKTILRALLLRVGNFVSTPNVTAVTALTNIGVQGKLKGGGLMTLKEKQPTAFYTSEIGVDRNGIALTAGYILVDLVNDRSKQGHIVTEQYDSLDLVFDKTGTANTTMEVYQLCMLR